MLFVLMPSHLHVILKPIEFPTGMVVQQFGSFTAHQILKQLKEDQKQNLLDSFQANKRDQRHEHSIWQDVRPKTFSRANIRSRNWITFTTIPSTKSGIWRKFAANIALQAHVFTMMTKPRRLSWAISGIISKNAAGDGGWSIVATTMRL
jgi:hypothetical protein